MNTLELTDEEIRLLRSLVRLHGTVARSNACDPYAREAERSSSEHEWRLCAGLHRKLKTSDDLLLEQAERTPMMEVMGR